jgi:hypothetical protein
MISILRLSCEDDIDGRFPSTRFLRSFAANHYLSRDFEWYLRADLKPRQDQGNRTLPDGPPETLVWPSRATAQQAQIIDTR